MKWINLKKCFDRKTRRILEDFIMIVFFATVVAIILIAITIYAFWDIVIVLFKIWLFNLIISLIVGLWFFVVFHDAIIKLIQR